MFITKDVYLSATLIVMSFKRIFHDNNIQIIFGNFYFEDSDKLRKIVDNYHKGKLLVDARKFLNVLKKIKK